MMHNGGINIIRRPLHVREGLAKIFGVTICIAPFQQTRERKEGNQESYKILRNL